MSADHVEPQRHEDPTEQSRWRPFRLLRQAMEDDIARVYQDAGMEDFKTSWVMEILRLRARGPMTISELAASVQRTHSALSQKVAAMRAAGLVETTQGADARSKTVALTPRAQEIANRLAAEWRATEAAIARLEDEIPYPLSRAVADIEEALARRSFHDRIRDELDRSGERV
jgi:DNA-binding MarR family transcriptional regulator